MTTHRPARIALAVVLAICASASLPAQPPAPLERHEFIIRDFRTESGAILPEAHIAYSALGTLNADGSNAILLPSHYMANVNG